jgi:lactate permease
MEHRQLGGSGLMVPALTLGTGAFGDGSSEFFRGFGALGQAEVDRLVGVALDAGVTMFDSADAYSGGQAEELLGKALRGRRDEVLISTKATFRTGRGPNDVGSSRWHLLRACEGSLRRLGTDRIDLFQLHGFDALTPVEEVLGTLDDLVRAGKIRYVGCSNFSGWHLMKSLAVADRRGLPRYVAHQAYYSLVGRDYEWELMPLAVDQRVGTVVWSPLGWGRLTGKLRRGQPPPELLLAARAEDERGHGGAAQEPVEGHLRHGLAHLGAHRLERVHHLEQVGVVELRAAGHGDGVAGAALRPGSTRPAPARCPTPTGTSAGSRIGIHRRWSDAGGTTGSRGSSTDRSARDPEAEDRRRPGAGPGSCGARPRPGLRPRAHHRHVRTAFALAPIAFLFWALAVRRWPGHAAAAGALLAALAVAVLAFGMPVRLALLSVLHGAAFGLWPIAWIIAAAVVLYELVVATGELEVVKAALGAATPDRRVQALLVAFGLGALLEGAAGFGTPIAIGGAMLAALGFEPVLAGSLALVANAAGVVFGGAGIGIEVAARVSGLSTAEVGALSGRMVPLLSLAIPFLLTTLVAGVRRGLQAWPAALAAGASFAAVQALAANLLGPQLVAVAAGLAAMGAVLLVARRFPAAAPFRFEGDPPAAAVAPPPLPQVLRAFSPFGLLILVVAAWSLPPVRALLDRATVTLPIPGLDGVLLRDGAPVRAVWRVDLLAATGTAVALGALCTAAALAASRADVALVLRRAGTSLRRPVLTIALVLGFAFLVNASGMAAALGETLARTGAAFPLAAPLLGWLGVVVTGSNTSSNALFGALQSATAVRLGLAPLLAVAANAVGGACAQMVTPQGMAVAAAGLPALAGREAALLRRTLPRSLGALAGMAVLSALFAGPLGALVPAGHGAARAAAASPGAWGPAALALAAAVALVAIALARRAGRRPGAPAHRDPGVVPREPSEMP